MSQSVNVNFKLDADVKTWDEKVQKAQEYYKMAAEINAELYFNLLLFD